MVTPHWKFHQNWEILSSSSLSTSLYSIRTLRSINRFNILVPELSLSIVNIFKGPKSGGSTFLNEYFLFRIASKMSSFKIIGFLRHSMRDMDFERGFLKFFHVGRKLNSEGGGGGGGGGGGSAKDTPSFFLVRISFFNFSFSLSAFSSLSRVLESSLRTISRYFRISAKARSWCSVFCLRYSDASWRYWKKGRMFSVR